jgi:hypothetical protein
MFRMTKVTCLLSHVEDRSKDKHIYKYKHYHIDIYIRLLEETRGRREKE